MIFAAIVGFMPNFLGHPDNYIEADPLKTPAHIVPEWYFLPFYAMLRAITFDILWINSKLAGVLAMFGSIALLLLLPGSTPAGCARGATGRCSRSGSGCSSSTS